MVQRKPALARLETAERGHIEPGRACHLGQGELSLGAQLTQAVAHLRLESLRLACHISKSA